MKLIPIIRYNYLWTIFLYGVLFNYYCLYDFAPLYEAVKHYILGK